MALSFHLNPLIPGGKKESDNCYSGPRNWLKTTAPLATAISMVIEDAGAKTAIAGPESKPKVVVIGAGIAGLRAASVLQRHGVDPIVLEARDRIGGRIFTSRKEGAAPKDIGTSTQVVVDTERQT